MGIVRRAKKQGWIYTARDKDQNQTPELVWWKPLAQNTST